MIESIAAVRRERSARHAQPGQADAAAPPAAGLPAAIRSIVPRLRFGRDSSTGNRRDLARSGASQLLQPSRGRVALPRFRQRRPRAARRDWPACAERWIGSLRAEALQRLRASHRCTGARSGHRAGRRPSEIATQALELTLNASHDHPMANGFSRPTPKLPAKHAGPGLLQDSLAHGSRRPHLPRRPRSLDPRASKPGGSSTTKPPTPTISTPPRRCPSYGRFSRLNWKPTPQILRNLHGPDTTIRAGALLSPHVAAGLVGD